MNPLDGVDEEPIANARPWPFERFGEHPRLRRRARAKRALAGGEDVEALLPPPFDISGALPVMGGVPPLGRDTARVLAWADYEPADIARLSEDGVA